MSLLQLEVSWFPAYRMSIRFLPLSLPKPVLLPACSQWQRFCSPPHPARFSSLCWLRLPTFRPMMISTGPSLGGPASGDRSPRNTL